MVSLGQYSKFQRLSRPGFVTALTSLDEVNQTLYGVWLSPGLVHYIYIFERGGGLLPTNGLLPSAKIFALLSSALNRGRHLYSAGRPSRWAPTHILVTLSSAQEKLWRRQDIRNELSVVVVLKTVDVVRSVFAELRQCLAVIMRVNGDKVARCPHFNTDQHEVDAQWMVQLQASVLKRFVRTTVATSHN